MFLDPIHEVDCRQLERLASYSREILNRRARKAPAGVLPFDSQHAAAFPWGVEQA